MCSYIWLGLHEAKQNLSFFFKVFEGFFHNIGYVHIHLVHCMSSAKEHEFPP